jgi:hypothetical protein
MKLLSKTMRQFEVHSKDNLITQNVNNRRLNAESRLRISPYVTVKKSKQISLSHS